METTIIAYKISKKDKDILEEICQEIDEKITIQITNIPEDIVGVPAFMAFIAFDDKKEYLQKCIEFIKDYMKYIIVDENTFEKIDILKKEIRKAYKNYNNNSL